MVTQHGLALKLVTFSAHSFPGIFAIEENCFSNLKIDFLARKWGKSSSSTNFPVADNRLVSARALVGSRHASNIYLTCMQMSTRSQTSRRKKANERKQANMKKEIKILKTQQVTTVQSLGASSCASNIYLTCMQMSTRSQTSKRKKANEGKQEHKQM